MKSDEIEAEIGLLMTRMQNEPADLTEFALQLIQKLNELEAYGMPLPEDLSALRVSLEEQLSADGPASDAPEPPPARA